MHCCVITAESRDSFAMLVFPCSQHIHDLPGELPGESRIDSGQARENPRGAGRPRGRGTGAATDLQRRHESGLCRTAGRFGKDVY